MTIKQISINFKITDKLEYEKVEVNNNNSHSSQIIKSKQYT